MFACGIPIFFQEVAAGQYLGAGGLTMVGQFVPILQGEELFIFGIKKKAHVLQFLRLKILFRYCINDYVPSLLTISDGSGIRKSGS